MKKIVEKSVKDFSSSLAVRGYWYRGEINLGRKERVTIDNYMIDGYDGDRCFVITYKKGKTFFSKEIEKSEVINELAFEPFYRSSEQGIKHMYAMLDCFDIKTMQFDKEKAMEIKQQFNNEISNTIAAQHEARKDQKVAIVEMNNKEENEL